MQTFIQRDQANDQVYIGFSQTGLKSGTVKKTIQATEDVALDFDARGRLVGLDISRASRLVGRDIFSDGLFGNELIGVAEAAKLCGVKKPNFIRDFVNRPDFPERIAELASGRIWLRSDIVSFLAARKSETSHSGSQRATTFRTYQALQNVLANDELAFRHNALTYFRNRYFLGGVPAAPTIEEVTLKSIQEDREAIAKAQVGDLDLYVMAAEELFRKYSPALSSYLTALMPTDRRQSTDDVFKRVWIDALRRIQRDEYGPTSTTSFSRWLLDVANEVLPSHGIESAVQPKSSPGTDPLQDMIQASRYEEALQEHSRRIAQLQMERLVLEYLSRLKAHEIEAFISSATRRPADHQQIEAARRLLQRRLTSIRSRQR